jgi:hypothetical protein
MLSSATKPAIGGCGDSDEIGGNEIGGIHEDSGNIKRVIGANSVDGNAECWRMSKDESGGSYSGRFACTRNVTVAVSTYDSTSINVTLDE